MKSKLLIIISLCSFSLLSCSELEQEAIMGSEKPLTRAALGMSDYYYYYNGKKIGLSSIKNMFYVSSKDSASLQNISASNNKIALNDDNVKKIHKDGHSNFWGIIKVKEDLQLMSTASKVMAIKSAIGNSGISIAPVFGSEESPLATSEYFCFKVKHDGNYMELQTIAAEKAVEIVDSVPYMPGWYVLKAPISSNGLLMSNTFYETGLFSDVDPSFMFDFRPNTCTLEPNEGNQWGLDKINMCDAWDITKGTSSVVVAVLDQGVDNNHNEFANNYSSLSYDIMNHSTPSVVRGNHGTHVGGIIGANHNGIQIAGIAPNATLLSISHDLYISPTISQELASGIGYARVNGASIINNSWGDQGGQFYDTMHSAILEDAINTAITTGRNGKGMVVIFASGNWNSTTADYPGNCNPDILVVGSINSLENRSSFSSYGNCLDIMAPGENILSTLPNNAIGYMSGTSMAAPHVAGIAALILSVNPSLTGKQVVNIIEKSARKLPAYSYSFTSGRTNGTWNSETGYGVCDALAALQMAQQDITLNNTVISSDTSVYGWNIYFNNVSVTNAANLTLSIGNSLTISAPFTVNTGTGLIIY